MKLKILRKPNGPLPTTINYPFHDLLMALDLLGPEARTWILSGAVITWPEDLLDEQMEVHDPRCRFSKDYQTVVFTQEILVRISDGLAGDWTNIYATSEPLENISPDRLSDPPAFPIEILFSCVDSAFWVIESQRYDLAVLLQAHGFATEIMDHAPRFLMSIATTHSPKLPQ